MIDLRHGDCLELMKCIPDNSIDMVLTDPPYGTTACKWDAVVDFDLMWKELKRITKDNGAICLFGSEPFSSALRMSNIKMFKYDWIWEKNRGSNFLRSNKEPLKKHEIISVFGSSFKYYPVPRDLPDSTKKRRTRKHKDSRDKKTNGVYGDDSELKRIDYTGTNTGKPISIIKFNLEQNNQFKKHVFHSTQKPVALLEYLIKTYTLENETVLDFTMGSGSTGVACKNLNRDFIGIEKDEKYFNIAKDRIGVS